MDAIHLPCRRNNRYEKVAANFLTGVAHLSETHRLAVDPNNGSVAFLDSQSFEFDDLVQRTLQLEKRVGSPDAHHSHSTATSATRSEPSGAMRRPA